MRAVGPRMTETEGATSSDRILPRHTEGVDSVPPIRINRAPTRTAQAMLLPEPFALTVILPR